MLRSELGASKMRPKRSVSPKHGPKGTCSRAPFETQPYGLLLRVRSHWNGGVNRSPPLVQSWFVPRSSFRADSMPTVRS